MSPRRAGPVVIDRVKRVGALLTQYPSMTQHEAFLAVAREDGVSASAVRSGYQRIQRAAAKANGTTPAPAPAPLPPPPPPPPPLPPAASNGDAQSSEDDEWVTIHPPSLRVLLQEALRRLDQMDKLVR